MNLSNKYHKKKKAKNFANDLDAQNSALKKIINALRKSFSRSEDEGKKNNLLLILTGCIFLFFSILSSQASENGRSVFASAGDFQKVSGVSIEWTLGETIIDSYATGGKTISQGFHQTGLLTTSIPGILTNGLTIYPNPFSNELNVNLPESNQVVQVKIFDIQGKVLFKNQLCNSANNLHPGNLDAGMYFLQLYINDEFKTIKIIKN